MSKKKVEGVDYMTKKCQDERDKAINMSKEEALEICRDLYAPFARKICGLSSTTAILLGKTTPVNYASYRKLKDGFNTQLSTFLRSMHRMFEAMNYRFHLAHEFDAIISAVSQGMCVVMQENVAKEDMDHYPEASHYFVHSTETQDQYPYPNGKVSKDERTLLRKQSVARANVFIKSVVTRFAYAYYPFVENISVQDLEDKSFISHSSYEKLFSGKPMYLTTFLRMLTSFFDYSKRLFFRGNRCEALERAVATGTSIVLLIVPCADLYLYEKKNHLFV